MPGVDAGAPGHVRRGRRYGPPFNVREDAWDTFSDQEDFQRFTSDWIREAARISGCVASFFSAKFLPTLRKAANDCGIPYRRSLVWRKPPGSQFAGASLDGFWYDFEMISVFGKPRKPRVRAEEFGVLTYRTVTGQQHGCQKPVELLASLIRGYSLPGDMVLDPFMGTGTVAEAALSCGRHFLGFEIDKKSHKLAVRRVSGLSMQTPMFEQDAPKPKAGDLFEDAAEWEV